MANLKSVQYNCRKRINDPEIIKLAREFVNNPFTPSPKDLMHDFYQSIGMDVEYDDIFNRE